MQTYNPFLLTSSSVFIGLEDEVIVSICAVYFSIVYNAICNKAKVSWRFQNTLNFPLSFVFWYSSRFQVLVCRL